MWPQRSFTRYVPRGGRILDIGCGDFGRVTRAVSRLRPDIAIVGVERYDDGTIYERGIDRRGLAHPVVSCDIEREALPFEDAAFDGVYCSHVIEHVEAKAHVLREIERVLRPGGASYVETPGPNASRRLRPSWVAPDFGGTITYDDDPTHLGAPLDVPGLRRLCSSGLLEPVEAGVFREFGRLGMPVYAVMVAAGLCLSPRKLGSQLFGAGLWNLTGFAIYCVARKAAPEPASARMRAMSPGVRSSPGNSFAVSAPIVSMRRRASR